MTTDAVTIFVAFAVASLIVILLAISQRESLASKAVLDLSAEKLGIVLKTNAFGLLILLAICLIGAGVFFLYNDYDKRLVTLQQESDKRAEEIARLKQEMEGRTQILDDVTQKMRDTLDDITGSLKEYNLRLALNIPNNEANPYHSKVFAYVQRKGDLAEKPYDVALERGFGGMVVNFSKLRLGDRLYVVVKDDDIGKTWISEHMTVPETTLRMTEQEMN
ncbi:MAG: hypothetical protein AAF512_18015 [Pseudomonadota bacterium]